MIKNSFKFACLIVTVGYAGSACAYNAGRIDEECKLPKFKTFNPANKSEVDPESEISFTVSGYADPTTIKVMAKNIPLEPKIIDKNSFFAVSAKLPAALNGKYARIHLKANNTSECKAKDGWLIKIRDNAVSPELESTQEVSAEVGKETQ